VAQYKVSATGTLVYVPGVAGGGNEPKSVALAGRDGKLQLIGLTAQPLGFPDPSRSFRPTGAGWRTSPQKQGAPRSTRGPTRASERQLTNENHRRAHQETDEGTDEKPTRDDCGAG
jgi:hypothetical protein